MLLFAFLEESNRTMGEICFFTFLFLPATDTHKLYKRILNVVKLMTSVCNHITAAKMWFEQRNNINVLAYATQGT